MAAEPKYDMTVYPTAGLVRSASNGAVTHQVTLPSCDCADFINRKGRLAWAQDAGHTVTICKHIAEFMERIGGWNRPAALGRGPVSTETFHGITRQRARCLAVEAGVSSQALTRAFERMSSLVPAAFSVDGGQVVIEIEGSGYALTRPEQAVTG